MKAKHDPLLLVWITSFASARIRPDGRSLQQKDELRSLFHSDSNA